MLPSTQGRCRPTRQQFARDVRFRRRAADPAVPDPAELDPFRAWRRGALPVRGYSKFFTIDCSWTPVPTRGFYMTPQRATPPPPEARREGDRRRTVAAASTRPAPGISAGTVRPVRRQRDLQEEEERRGRTLRCLLSAQSGGGGGATTCSVECNGSGSVAAGTYCDIQGANEPGAR